MLLFRFRGKSCLSLFMLLLKTKLALALVRFWCFLIHVSHYGTFLLKEISQRNCTPRKIFVIGDDVAFPIACARVVVRPGHSTKIEKASRLVPSLKGEGINRPDSLFIQVWRSPVAIETTNISQGNNGVGVASSYLDFLQNVFMTTAKFTKKNKRYFHQCLDVVLGG